VSYFHIQAQLPGGKPKSLFNRTEDQALDIVSEFVQEGTLTSRWGNRTQTRQAYELKVYETEDAWDRKAGGGFSDFVGGRRNVFSRLERDVK
jgi:hypothetical protein